MLKHKKLKRRNWNRVSWKIFCDFPAVSSLGRYVFSRQRNRKSSKKSVRHRCYRGGFPRSAWSLKGIYSWVWGWERAALRSVKGRKEGGWNRKKGLFSTVCSIHILENLVRTWLAASANFHRKRLRPYVCLREIDSDVHCSWSGILEQ